jgi:hypothetical protein
MVVLLMSKHEPGNTFMEPYTSPAAIIIMWLLASGVFSVAGILYWGLGEAPLCLRDVARNSFIAIWTR